MFQQIIEKLKGWLRKLVQYRNIEEALDVDAITSDSMSESIDLWWNMYSDTSPWIDKKNGVYSLGLAGEVCNKLAKSVTLELEIKVQDPNTKESSEILDSTIVSTPMTRAKFIQDVIDKVLLKNLKSKLEMGMATGGMVIKPYVSNNRVYLDYAVQGEFLPIEFDDDGKITEIAFIDSFISGNDKYTKIEHHKFIGGAGNALGSISVTNQAYVLRNASSYTNNQLGIQIDLTQVPKWSTISPEVNIDNVDRALYGYYRVNRPNHIDKQSPLGVSIFSRAVSTIERCDRQFSRLDWEYEGGELAIDVDPTALQPIKKVDPVTRREYAVYPQLNNRLFRKVDVGEDNTYQPYNPSLRDASYLNGLNKYLMRVEDLCGLGRGTLCQDNSSSQYTNEEHLLANKQEYYSTVQDNQKNLQDCLEDVIYAINVYSTLYNLCPQGQYDVSYTWDDSIINNPKAQLEQMLQLKKEGVLGKEEVRAWYTGESLETAKTKIDEINEANRSPLNDIFSASVENVNDKDLEE